MEVNVRQFREIARLIRNVISDLSYATALRDDYNIILTEEAKTDALRIAAMALRLAIDTTALPRYITKLVDEDFEKIREAVDQEDRQSQFVEDNIEAYDFILGDEYARVTPTPKEGT